REIGENDERDESRQQCQSDDGEPECAAIAAFGVRTGKSRFGSYSLIDAHEPCGRGRAPAKIVWTFGNGLAPQRTDAFIQQCCRIETIPRHESHRFSKPAGYWLPRKTWMSRSRIFLRNVLRLTPKRSAARIWLPRVAASAAVNSGYSTSRKMRW